MMRGVLKHIALAALGVAAGLSAATAWAGDAGKGRSLFEDYCSECHTVQPGGSQRKAPNLFGMMGRRTGASPGFDYSQANLQANWTWSPDILERYLADPRKAMPGTVMKFKGVPDAAERADLVAFLSNLR